MEKIKSTRSIYKGKILNLRVDTIEINGKNAQREIVEHTEASAILAITNEKKIVLVKQYRIAVNKELKEIPAGLIDHNETPEQAALRELEEETGYKAKNIQKITSAYTSAGFSNEKIHLFLAWNLLKGKMNLDEGEKITVEEHPIEQIDELLKECEDFKTIAAFLYLKNKKEEIVKNINK